MLGGAVQSSQESVTPPGAEIVLPSSVAVMGSIAVADRGSAVTETSAPIRPRLTESISSRTVIRLSFARVPGSTMLSTTPPWAEARPPVTATSAIPRRAFASIASAVSVSRPRSDGRFVTSVSEVAR